MFFNPVEFLHGFALFLDKISLWNNFNSLCVFRFVDLKKHARQLTGSDFPRVLAG